MKLDRVVDVAGMSAIAAKKRIKVGMSLRKGGPESFFALLSTFKPHPAWQTKVQQWNKSFPCQNSQKDINAVSPVFSLSNSQKDINVAAGNVGQQLAPLRPG